MKKIDGNDDRSATKYNSMKGLLGAKARKALPRGTRYIVSDEVVRFVDGKGSELFRIPLQEYAEGALAREGFKAK